MPDPALLPLAEVPDLRDDDLLVRLRERTPADPVRGFVPAYSFALLLAGREAGRLALRVGVSDDLIRYHGQVGYRVEEPFRGRRVAARALRLILPLAHHHGLDPLWIACHPENAASRRTLELAGAELVEVVALPKDCDQYRRGERQACRYRMATSLGHPRR